jgi:hypothetical protein
MPSIGDVTEKVTDAIGGVAGTDSVWAVGSSNNDVPGKSDSLVEHHVGLAMTDRFASPAPGCDWPCHIQRHPPETISGSAYGRVAKPAAQAEALR